MVRTVSIIALSPDGAQMSRKLALRTTVLVAATGVAAATALVAAPVGAARPPGASAHRDAAAARVLATGLNNPRHLVFRGGTLYVAEAGKGGTKNCGPGPEGGTVCYGATGSIMRLGKHPRRIITGLPSIGDKGTGASALGPAGITALKGDRLAFTIGGGGTPAHRATLPASGRKIGTLVLAQHRGKNWSRKTLRIVADLMRYEARKDPDHQGADSDPTGLIRRNGRFLLTDSGGNDLLRAGGGKPAVALRTFGNRMVKNPFGPGNVPMQSVPTAVAVGPGGALFVSELTGFPFPQGAARIFRLVPGKRTQVWATGLTNVTDLTWYRGSLYAVQLSNTGLLNPGLPVGSLVKVRHGSTHTRIGSNLHAPYGVAMRHGAAFVTTCAVCAGGGKVVRMQLP
jgi:hypothetical protein